MDDKPESAPAHCPGTQSEDAGKAAACAGCPNQRICASGQPKLPDPDVGVIQERLSSVKNILLVLSGKGGVGKSTVSAMIARALALDGNKEIGLLDVDICGPSQPRILGAVGEQVHTSGSGWSPVYVDDNLSVMSVGFLLDNPEDAVIWRGPKKTGMIKQFLRDVDWGSLEYLVIDTPPGTSDEHLSLVQFLGSLRKTAAIIVTTPQEVALLDVRKEITFCKKVGLQVLGIVENMSVFVCPKCKVPSSIFPPTTGGGEQLAKDTGLLLLASLPLDPVLAQCCDEGLNFLTEHPTSQAAQLYKQLAGDIVRKCQLLGTEQKSSSEL